MTSGCGNFLGEESGCHSLNSRQTVVLQQTMNTEPHLRHILVHDTTATLGSSHLTPSSQELRGRKEEVRQQGALLVETCMPKTLLPGIHRELRNLAEKAPYHLWEHMCIIKTRTLVERCYRCFWGGLRGNEEHVIGNWCREKLHYLVAEVWLNCILVVWKAKTDLESNESGELGE